MQLKKDTILKHCGKRYQYEEVDGNRIRVIKKKDKTKCLHIKYEEMYENKMNRRKKIYEKGGIIN